MTIYRPQKWKAFKTDRRGAADTLSAGAGEETICPQSYKIVRQWEFATIITVICSRWLSYNCEDTEELDRPRIYSFSLLYDHNHEATKVLQRL